MDAVFDVLEIRPDAGLDDLPDEVRVYVVCVCV